MGVSLLRGENFVSLEYASEDHEAVKAALRELFGKLEIAQHLASARVTVAGEDFTLQNDWDDPCLITRTAKGAEMLEPVATRLGHTAI